MAPPVPVNVHEPQLRDQLARLAEQHQRNAALAAQAGVGATIVTNPKAREAQRTPAAAIARSLATHHEVVPLVATAGAALAGWTVLPDVDDAGQYIDRWDVAQPGITIGRASNLIAVLITHQAGLDWLRDQATEERHDPDDDRSWVERREVGGTRLSVAAPPPQLPRFIGGHARQVDRQLREAQAERRAFTETAWLWSYPTEISGQDLYDYPARKIHHGVTLLGPDDVLPAPGVTLPDGRTIVGSLPPYDTPPPPWVAALLGKRKAGGAG